MQVGPALYSPVPETLGSDELKVSLLLFWSLYIWESDVSQLPFSSHLQLAMAKPWKGAWQPVWISQST